MTETTVSNTPVRPEHSFPTQPPPKTARAVIIGGGVAGASVAYHLSALGWKDIVLLDQGQIGSGTSWHAAGMVGQLRTSHSQTKINKASIDLYRGLADETGHDIGWLEVGSLIVGTCEERMSQLRRTAAMAEVFDVEAHMLTADAAREKWPLIRTDDVLGAVWLPHDGRVIPAHTAIAMAKGAASRGVIISEHTRVEKLLTRGNRVVGVATNHGEIHSEWVILTGGMWSRQLGLQISVDIPLYPVEHHYILSEPIVGASRHLPCGRDPDAAIYFRTLDDGSIKLGAFQKRSQSWLIERIPDDFNFSLLSADWERFAEPLKAGKHRIPLLENARFPKFVNGPESFTPDNQFLMGEPPECEGLFVLAGFNSTGIACAGGAGKYAAEWLENGGPTLDLWSVDIRRFAAFQNDRSYLRERVTETLGLHYQLAWPNREFETARGIRQTALYDRLKDRGACFGTSMGWERANWFAPIGVCPETHYSFQQQNWFPYVAEEVRQCRENVVLLDQSTFAKFVFRGSQALPILQHLCGADIDVPNGKAVYTGMFNDRGGFESDLTAVRVSEDEFYLISSTGQVVRDFNWISRHIPAGADAELIDVTSMFGVLSVMGPQSRTVLQSVTASDLSNTAFPFGTAQEIEIADSVVRAIRLSYVGELGWELHAPFVELASLYDTMLEAGSALGIAHAGTYAIQAMRLEKAYRAWGHELSTADTPIEAGLTFAIDWTKPFLGKERLLRAREEPLRKRLITLVLKDPQAPPLWGSEPILADGAIVGYTTSAAYAPTLGASVAMGYVRHPTGEAVTREWLQSCQFQIKNNGTAFDAIAHTSAPYDPKRLKMLQ